MPSDKRLVQTSREPTPWDTVNHVVELYDAPPAPSRHPPPDTRHPTSGGAFTIPLICLGLGLIACCILIPAADENRHIAYETAQLKADLEQLQKQVDTNDAFLHRIASDPTLSERLARRQMKMMPQGAAVLELKTRAKAAAEMSPFLLVTVPPPAPMPPYQPVGGFLAGLCRKPKTQLYLIGGSLMMIATGLVLSRTSREDARQA